MPIVKVLACARRGGALSRRQKSIAMAMRASVRRVVIRNLLSKCRLFCPPIFGERHRVSDDSFESQSRPDAQSLSTETSLNFLASSERSASMEEQSRRMTSSRLPAGVFAEELRIEKM